MKITIPKNRMEIKHFPKNLDLALVILFTLLCIPFVLIPPLNEISPIRTILGLPLVLFLPGYSLTATLFPRKDDLDAIERIALSFGLKHCNYPVIGLSIELHAIWNMIVPCSYCSVSIHDFACLRCVCKKKQDSGRG
jgi:uncharacterized membrane protein